MNPLVPVIAGVLGAAITGAVAYAVARRQRSGRVDTTEAATLWAEGQAMRKELREENLALRTEILALRAEVTAWRVEALALRSEVEGLRRRVAALDGPLAGDVVVPEATNGGGRK